MNTPHDYAPDCERRDAAAARRERIHAALCGVAALLLILTGGFA